MAQPATDIEPAKPAWKRYVFIGVPILLVLVIAGVIFWPRIQVSFWINGLNSDIPATRNEMLQRLRDQPADREWVNELLLAAVKDEDRTFQVRTMCAGVLMKRQRRRLLDRELVGGDLGTRAVIISRYRHEESFKTAYVEDERYRIRETVAEWLARDGDWSRGEAILLARDLKMNELMPLIRPLLVRSSDPSASPTGQRDILVAAASAVRDFADCESVPRLFELARKDPEPLVRLRTLQVVWATAFKPNAVCPDAIPTEDMQNALVAALDDAAHSVRMGALVIFEGAPSWAVLAKDRLRQILEKSDNETQRRHALQVLAAMEDPALSNDFAQFFHDRSPNVRSSAVSKAGSFEGRRFESGLIGLVQRETESEVVFWGALEGLHRVGRRWLGLPDATARLWETDPKQRQAQAAELFRTGAVEGATRQTIASAWFAWLCDELKLSPKEKEDAIAARAAFWRAADQGDVAGARKALASLGHDVPGLFAYEQGWLALRE